MVIRVLDVDTGKQLFVSDRVKGSQLQKSGSNLSDTVVSDVMKWLEENMSLQELSAEEVKVAVPSRLDSIRSISEPSNPLAILVEVRLYQHMNNLTAEKANAYYSQFLSSADANILANGTAEQRRDMVESSVKKLEQ